MSEWLKTCDILLKLAVLGDAKAAADLKQRMEKVADEIEQLRAENEKLQKEVARLERLFV